MSNNFDRFFNSKQFAELTAFLEDDEKREKLQRNLNVLVIGLMSRRAARKGLVAAGLSDEQAKLIAKAIPSLAWLIGTNFTSGSLHAEDSYEDLYPRDEDSD
jgi:hypothetical protein